MTPDLLQLLIEMKSTLGRLEERIGKLESRTIPDTGSGDQPPPPSPEEQKEIDRLVKIAEHTQEQRLLEAEKFIEADRNGTLTEEERQEYFDRWTMAARP